MEKEVGREAVKILMVTSATLSLLVSAMTDVTTELFFKLLFKHNLCSKIKSGLRQIRGLDAYSREFSNRKLSFFYFSFFSHIHSRMLQ